MYTTTRPFGSGRELRKPQSPTKEKERKAGVGISSAIRAESDFRASEGQ